MLEVRKLVTMKQLRTVYGIPYSGTQIRRLMQQSKFPLNFVLGKARIAWYADEVENWIETRPRATVKTDA